MAVYLCKAILASHLIDPKILKPLSHLITEKTMPIAHTPRQPPKNQSTTWHGTHAVKPAYPNRSLGRIVAGLLFCTLPFPSAEALTFGDGNSITNPFFFDGTSSDSSWSLTLDGSPQSGWAIDDAPPCDPGNGLCVSPTSPSSVTIAGSGDVNSVTSWTSNNTSTSYSISFAWAFDELSDSGSSTPFYTINGLQTNLAGVSGTVTSATLNSGSTIAFGISNVDGFGDLTISNFNATEATPVPAPLPLLGAGATFAWIRKRRAQLKTRQSMR